MRIVYIVSAKGFGSITQQHWQAEMQLALCQTSDLGHQPAVM
jgi:hypothetical protein